MLGPFWIDDNAPVDHFPPPQLALEEPNGLLAVGGDLRPERILAGYRQSIFPWYSEGQPILWWSPNPRAVLLPEQLKISRSLRKRLRKQPFEITLDQDFEAVIQACAEPRSYESETWISPEIQRAYIALHRQNYAHSVEAWQGGYLVGGLYGIALGKIFFGESMFCRATDASKVAFTYLTRQLQQWGYKLIDCQVSSQHLQSLGAIEIDRSEFLALLKTHIDQPGQPTPWRFDEGFDPLT